MIELLYVDLFCGAGGTSTGINSAELDGERCAEVIACVNHDANAIASHRANHPSAMHFTEDIRTLDLTPLQLHLSRYRVRYPDAKVVLWASIECTNFSKAKGGKPRDPDSRTLAEHLYRYIEALEPDYIQVENVVEFMSWGAIDVNGKPLSRDRGTSYLRWVNRIKRYGYDYGYRILNAANFGAITTRKRYFGMFARFGLPISFPGPTHCKDGDNGLFEPLPRWRAVREVLDFSDEGDSILQRKRPLSEKTLKRIYAGLKKFVDRDHNAFVSVHYGTGFNSPCDAPAPTITTKDKLSLVQCRFIVNEYSGGGQVSAIDAPCPAVLTNPKQKLVTVKTFLHKPQYSSARDSVDKRCFTHRESINKHRPQLVIGLCGKAASPIYPSESPMTVSIKKFMSQHQIADIRMRMFRIRELKLIMGFPEDYVLKGTQTDQKKYIGNAVECVMARSLCTALAKGLRDAGLTKGNTFTA